MQQVLRALVFGGALLSPPLWGQDQPLPAGASFTVHDLQFTVLNIGGAVHDLKVKETETEIHIELAADVLFDFDKSEMRKDAAATLKQAGAMIGEKAKGMVRIEGHTDARGIDAYNQKLSERRAQSVKNWLVQKEGLGKVSIQTQGFGAKKPVAPNAKPDGSDDPQGRQKNRRVDIIIMK